MTSQIEMISNVEVIETLGNSDHNILVWKLTCSVKCTKMKQPYRQFNRAIYEDMRNWFTQINWEEDFKNHYVENRWAKFCDLIKLAIE